MTRTVAVMNSTPFPSPAPLPSLERYREHLRETTEWIRRSERPLGGSAAYWAPGFGWSLAYPETTGYLIPTLLRVARVLDDATLESLALRMGEWLLHIRNLDGSWNGGLHPPRNPSPSVFNTGQILKGLLALWDSSRDRRWLEAAVAGEGWLRRNMGPDGLWDGEYRSRETPSYYTHVLWPMLEVSRASGDPRGPRAVRRALTTILDRRLPNGVIRGWGFHPGQPAFTHTIAYTLRGIQECGRLLDDHEVVEAARPALERLLRRSELAGGDLPGAFRDDWSPAGAYVCLTGNAQLALCLLRMEEADASAGRPDLRVVSAAARLVDAVCRRQRIGSPWPEGLRGAVAGSHPLFGAYMRFRYPNWAAKYLLDALMAVSKRVEAEAG